MREETGEAHRNTDARIDAGGDIPCAHAVAVAVDVGRNYECCLGGREQYGDVCGSRDRLRAGESETTGKIARRAERPAPFDASGELRDRSRSHDRNGGRDEQQFYQRVAVGSARGPRAARRAPATRHVGY